MRKVIAVMMLAVFLSVVSVGCARMGEMTGKAVKEVKDLPKDFKEGYQKGRNGEAED